MPNSNNAMILQYIHHNFITLLQPYHSESIQSVILKYLKNEHCHLLLAHVRMCSVKVIILLWNNFLHFIHTTNLAWQQQPLSPQHFYFKSCAEEDKDTVRREPCDSCGVAVGATTDIFLNSQLILHDVM